MVVERQRRWLGPLLCTLMAACTTLPGASVVPSPIASDPPAIRAGSPDEVGFDTLALADAVRSIAASGVPVHDVVIVRDGMLVLDATFHPYDGTTPHAIGGVTTVVLSTLLGIALDRGLLELDDPVLRWFPDRPAADIDPRWDDVTVRHLATMTAGFACTVTDDSSTLAAMTASDDWIGFVLGQPMEAQPGTRFRACRPVSHLLAAVIQEAGGVSTLDFARQFLFEPLEITAVRWPSDPQGYPHGWGDLAMRPMDLARIGQLWLRHGRWDGARVVSSDWVTRATQVQVTTGALHDYGFGWWIPRGATPGTMEASGDGGQSLAVREDLDLVVVTAGSGIDPAEVSAPLVDALVSPGEAFPRDTWAVGSLRDALDAVRAEPDAASVMTPPAASIAVLSGKTWALDRNPLGLRTLALDLEDADGDGSIRLAFDDTRTDQAGPIGLDSRDRVGLDRHRRPVAIRGAWLDGRTFEIVVDEVTDGRAFRLRLGVEDGGERLRIEGQEVGHDTGFVIEGRVAR